MNFLRKLFMCFFAWEAGPTEIKDPDVILVHAAGDYDDGTPGSVNEEIASLVRRFCLEYPRLTILAQAEVGQCLGDLPVQIIVPRQRDRMDKYIDTKEVADRQLAICKLNGWKRPILFSFQPHIVRALMTTEKTFGVAVMVPKGLPKGYDKRSSLKWQRSRITEVTREIGARMLYLFKGLI